MTDLTDEVRAEIARLCGGELRHDEENGDWWFFPLGKRADGTDYGATAPLDEWLPARYVLGLAGGSMWLWLWAAGALLVEHFGALGTWALMCASLMTFLAFCATEEEPK